jgi:ABC-type polysaccharide/polyol phosphate transport system ATPase subunit
MPLIQLDQIGLRFQVRCFGRISLKEYLLKGFFRRSKKTTFEVQALDGINLTVDEGDRLGIIGPNGAGKSTLLKLLAGVYPPTAGRRLVKGQISSLFDIALGFESEATGWENINYRSYLQGETPRTIKDKVQPIAEFSELGDFLDMPVRHYSSGMSVRLAFSIATAIEPEILLVDEVLSAGDMAFQEKARQRMKDMMKKAKIIVMVSHDLASIARLCDRAIWLDHGTIRANGPVNEVIDTYTNHVNGQAKAAA